MSSDAWAPPGEGGRVVLDHALLARLDQGSDAARWDAALAQMGVPQRVLGPEWPEPLRVLARERVVPEGIDRWLALRIASWAFALALAFGVPLATMVAWGPLGLCTPFVVTPVVLIVARSAIDQLAPRAASSEKAKQLAAASRALRAMDFVGRHGDLFVENDPSGAWLAEVERAACRMDADAESAGGGRAATAQLKEALATLLDLTRAARRRREAQLKEAEATVRAAEGVVFVPADFELDGAVATVDAVARLIEPYPRWLPKLPAR
jgi:hypothetical protein